MFRKVELEDRQMRKLAFAFVAALALAAPTVASAQVFSVRIGDDGYGYGPRYYGDYDRGYYRHHDRGWHRGWYYRHGERVFIRRHHHDWDDWD